MFHMFFNVFGVSYILVHVLEILYVLDVSEQTVFFHRTEEACVFYLLQNE
jgi:hypothetical protein